MKYIAISRALLEYIPVHGHLYLSYVCVNMSYSFANKLVIYVPYSVVVANNPKFMCDMCL